MAYTLTKKELEMLELLWNAGEPLTRQEILDRAEIKQCSWKPNSIHLILNSMLIKGAVQVAGFYLNSRKLGRTYEPAVSKEGYYVMQVRIALENTREAAGLEPKKVLRDLLKEEKEKP